MGFPKGCERALLLVFRLSIGSGKEIKQEGIVLFVSLKS